MEWRIWRVELELPSMFVNVTWIITMLFPKTFHCFSSASFSDSILMLQMRCQSVQRLDTGYKSTRSMSFRGREKI